MDEIDYKNTPEYQAGVARFCKRYDEKRHHQIEKLYKLSPALAHTFMGNILYDVWDRKTSKLSLRDKEIATLASIVTSGVATREIQAHIENMLSIGVTKEEITELLVLLTVYASAPNVWMIIPLVIEVFEQFDAQQANKK